MERTAFQPEQLGLTLGEAKSLLENVQQTMVTQQINAYIAQRRNCPHCGKARRRKGKHGMVYRTLFGKLELEISRLYECSCQQGKERRSVSLLAELLRERTAPELMRWTKRGAHLLLQVRTRVLNKEFRETFSGWYPGMRVTSGAEGQEELAA